MKYAVFLYKGVQYKAVPGQKIKIPGIAGKKGERIQFDKVLLAVGDKEQKIGMPSLQKVSVSGTVLENKKAEKVKVLKYKAKSRYRRRIGQRSFYTVVKIDKISV